MKKTLYLMRHAQTIFNVRFKIQGVSDSPLSKLGIQQALKTKTFIDTLEIDHAYSSTSERSRDTLELVLDNRLEYQALKELKEMNFGQFEGESEEFMPKDHLTINDYFVPFGGESQTDMKKRIVKAVKEIMKKEDHTNVLIVTHGFTSIAFLSYYCDNQEILSRRFLNAGVMTFEVDEDHYELKDIYSPGI